MNKRLKVMLKGPILKMVCKLSFPNFVGVSSMTLVIFADAFFIGQLGIVHLASLAIVFPFTALMQMMSAGAIGGATTSSISRSLGNGSNSNAETAAWHAIVIGIIISLIFTIFLGIFPKYIFNFMSDENEVLNGAVGYAHIAFGGSVFIWLVYIFSAILRALGDVVTPARVQILGGIVQVFLSGILTLGWFGTTKFGILGPAIAMVITHISMALYLFIYIQFKQSQIRLIPQFLNKKSFLDIMKVGSGGLINSITIAGTVAVVTGTVSNYGIEALAGYGLGSRLEIILTPLVFGIGSVLTASVGVNVGAKQFVRARKIAWTGAAISFLMVGIIGFTVTVFPEIWLNNFDANFLTKQFGILYLSIVAPFYCLFGAGQALYFASQGTGKIALPVSVGVLRFATVSITAYLALHFSLTIDIIFYAVSVGLTITGVGLALCLFGPDWKSSN